MSDVENKRRRITDEQRDRIREYFGRHLDRGVWGEKTGTWFCAYCGRHAEFDNDWPMFWGPIEGPFLTLCDKKCADEMGEEERNRVWTRDHARAAFAGIVQHADEKYALQLAKEWGITEYVEAVAQEKREQRDQRLRDAVRFEVDVASPKTLRKWWKMMKRDINEPNPVL